MKRWMTELNDEQETWKYRAWRFDPRKANGPVQTYDPRISMQYIEEKKEIDFLLHFSPLPKIHMQHH